MSNKSLVLAGAGLVGVGVVTYFAVKAKAKEDTITIPPGMEDRVAELESEGLSREEALVQALYESTQSSLDDSQQYEDDNSDILDDLYNDAEQSQQESSDAIEDAINDPTDAEKQAAAQQAAADAAAKLQAAADAQKLVVQQKVVTLSRMVTNINAAKDSCDQAAQKVIAKAKFITDIETKRNWAGWLCQDSNYGGSRFGIYNGDRIPRLGDVWRNDSASSIQVKGYYKVTLYQHVDFGGSAFPIYSDDGSDIRIAILGSVWRNDSASSLRVEPHTNYLRNELTQLKVDAVSIASMARDLQNAVNVQIEATQRAAADLAILNLYQSFVGSVNSLIMAITFRLAILNTTINLVEALDK